MMMNIDQIKQVLVGRRFTVLTRMKDWSFVIKDMHEICEGVALIGDIEENFFLSRVFVEDMAANPERYMLNSNDSYCNVPGDRGRGDEVVLLQSSEDTPLISYEKIYLPCTDKPDKDKEYMRARLIFH